MGVRRFVLAVCAVGLTLVLAGCASGSLSLMDMRKKLEGIESMGCATAESEAFTEPITYEALLCSPGADSSSSEPYYVIVSDAIASETFDTLACNVFSDTFTQYAFAATLRGHNWFVLFPTNTVKYAEAVHKQLGGELGSALADCAS